MPEREFVFEMESKESQAPTEIFVPRRQYPDGFFVWISDGAVTGQQQLALPQAAGHVARRGPEGPLVGGEGPVGLFEAFPRGCPAVVLERFVAATEVVG